MELWMLLLYAYLVMIPVFTIATMETPTRKELVPSLIVGLTWPLFLLVRVVDKLVMSLARRRT